MKSGVEEVKERCGEVKNGVGKVKSEVGTVKERNRRPLSGVETVTNRVEKCENEL